jgi:malate synthase
MAQYIEHSGIKIAEVIYKLVNDDICPGIGIDPTQFWRDFALIINEFAPKNSALLEKREALQLQLDQWHRSNRDHFNFDDYKTFLIDIGYLLPEVDDFQISPQNVDNEVAIQAGPQLVVPIMNARFALNAVNARWGSLYDALYGNDVIPERDGAEKTVSYNPVRGQKVIDYGRDFLDNAVPLAHGSHVHLVGYRVQNKRLVAVLDNGAETSLQDTSQFVGYLGGVESPTSILLKNNSLHIEIQVDRENNIGAVDPAGVKDIVLEAALTTIMDCEDSVAAVDADDKALAYRNWLGLIKGDLEETVQRGDSEFLRTMNGDRTFTSPDGSPIVLQGRSLMFVRNVGHLMTNPAILYGDGQEIPEGIMDGVITTLIGLYDLNKKDGLVNSRAGSIYIVKPKMHGPEEVRFTNDLFDRIEDMLGLERHTIKVGIMDEERRTSINLQQCIYAAKDRVVFVNTGFLDRTGDEIHTSMEAGPFALKAELKKMPWISAYEDRNVDIGLSCGFQGRAQIGKGMWPIPDNMADMMEAKIAHPNAGANTAWVPSPTAATLHAIHYHQTDVFALQTTLYERPTASIDDILTIPLLGDQALTADQIQQELNNNVQGILGYVVRWVDLGIGCSKVPDIFNIGLMEDRATLRISSQHIANWLHHGICTKQQVLETLKTMAKVVDKQNAGDISYSNMSPNLDNNVAFKAACDLIFKGVDQPNGYTEPLLHAYRAVAKAN